jgi:hypothetical protein
MNNPDKYNGAIKILEDSIKIYLGNISDIMQESNSMTDTEDAKGLINDLAFSYEMLMSSEYAITVLKEKKLYEQKTIEV